MREWNSYSDDLVLKDGRVVKEYTIRFQTTEYEVYKRIESFFQGLMDEPLAKDTNVRSKDEPQTCDTCKYGEDKHRYAHICNECGVGINNYEPKDEPQADCQWK